MPKAAGKKTVIGNFADALKLAERDIKGENAHKPVTLEELRKREARDVNLRIVGDKLIIEHTEVSSPLSGCLAVLSAWLEVQWLGVEVG